MIRVLFVTPELPFPVRSGTGASAAELIRELARRENVDLTAAVFEPVPSSIRAELPSVTWLSLPRATRRSTRTILAPRGVRAYYSPAARHRIGAVACDVVIAHRLHSVHAVADVNAQRSFILQDVVSAKADQSVRAPWLARRVRELQFFCLERWALPQFERVHVVSEGERRHIAERHPQHLGKTTVSRMGFHVEDFYAADDAEEGAVDVAYFGNLGSVRNQRAVERLSRILGLCRAAGRPLSAAAYGADGPEDFLTALKGFEHTGRVGDVDRALQAATIVVNPQQVASGVKTSVLRAMGASRACVISPAVADTIGGEHYEHYVVADSDPEFADRMIELLEDQNLRNRLGANAKAFVTREYSWPRYVDDLLKAP